jgi:hypothetical protein
VSRTFDAHLSRKADATMPLRRGVDQMLWVYITVTVAAALLVVV